MSESYRCRTCKATFKSRKALKQHRIAKHKSQVWLFRGVIIIAIIAVSVAVYVNQPYFSTLIDTKPKGPYSLGAVHWHAVLDIWIKGKRLDLQQKKYIERNGFVHFHEPENPGVDVVHIHARGVTLGFFFETLGMKFNSTCLVLDTREAYCTTGENVLSFVVNDSPNMDFDGYQPRDGDRIVIRYS